MIKKVCEAEKEALLAYLYQDPCLNLFFIGDVNNEGLEGPTCEVWWDKEGDTIQAAYLRYYTNLVVTGKPEAMNPQFVNEIIQQNAILNVNGEEKTVNALHLEGFMRDDCFFCRFSSPNLEIDCSDAELATPEDADEIFKISTEIFENKGENHIAENIRKGSSRYYVVRREGKIVSMAGSTAETKGLAMVVSVCTLGKYRNQSYASQCVAKLCQELLKEEKVACLFYNNPEAGKIYHRLGFEDIGRWALRRKIQND